MCHKKRSPEVWVLSAPCQNTFFESLLHVAYKEPLKKWQARTPEEKKVVKETKYKKISEKKWAFLSMYLKLDTEILIISVLINSVLTNYFRLFVF